MRKITLATASIPRSAKIHIGHILNSGRLSYGPYCRAYERKLALLHHQHYAIATNSGTSALEASIHALKIQHRWQDTDEILVPAVTFIADVNTVIRNGLVPRFVDVDPHYYDMDVAKIAAAVTPKTRAILVPHLFGQPAQMDKIYTVAKRNHLTIIEDASESILARYRGKPVGSWGDVCCFSTYAAHHITTGIGGAVTTNSKRLATIIRSLVNHGRNPRYLTIEDDDNLSDQNLDKIIKSRFDFLYQGYSFRLGELEAALGLAQLERWKSIIRPRQKNAAYLTKKLHTLSDFLQLPAVRPGADHVFMVYPLVVKKAVKRDDLVLYLERHGLETRPMLPLINQQALKVLNIRKIDYPIASYINDNGFYIGIHQDVTKKDLDYVAKQFYEYFHHYPNV